jgi:hypothetical protein
LVLEPFQSQAADPGFEEGGWAYTSLLGASDATSIALFSCVSPDFRHLKVVSSSSESGSLQTVIPSALVVALQREVPKTKVIPDEHGH